MKLSAYHYAGKTKTIKKNLGTATTLDYTYEIATDALNPTLRITISDSEQESDFKLFRYNYLKIPQTGTFSDALNRDKYYFVETDKIKNIARGIFLVPCKLDSLKTYETEILESEANVARSASNYNLYLNDTFYNAFAYPRIGCRMFPNGFSDTYNFLLTVCNTLG